MRAFLHRPGTRIRIRKGPFPQDPELLGREGVVVTVSVTRPGHYGVTLDGEDQIRSLPEEELEAVPMLERA